MNVERLKEAFSNRRAKAACGLALVACLSIAVWFLFPHIHRKPPSIFDTPVDGVLDYLMTDDFNRLSLEERMEFLAGIVKRFTSMSQSDSAVASAFLAGLTNDASAKIIDNARVLGKDILLQGANEYLALQTQQEKDAYIDKWLIGWVRYAEKTTGRSSGKSDEQVLSQLSKDAQRDVKRYGELDATLAQQILDFWERDVASVSTPKEQAQIFHFGPAIRQRILTRGQD